MFYLCVFSCWRTPETRKTACSVKAGLRAFPEHRETQERSSTVFSLPTIWSVWFTHRKPARIPKRASRPRMESSGLQGTVMLSVKPAQDWTSEETNSITSTASQISINWQLLLCHSHFACFPFASRRTGWNTLPPSPTPTLHTCIVGCQLQAPGDFQRAPRGRLVTTSVTGWGKPNE